MPNQLVSLRLPEDLIAEMDRAADADGLTLQQEMRRRLSRAGAHDSHAAMPDVEAIGYLARNIAEQASVFFTPDAGTHPEFLALVRDAMVLTLDDLGASKVEGTNLAKFPSEIAAWVSVSLRGAHPRENPEFHWNDIRAALKPQQDKPVLTAAKPSAKKGTPE